MNNIPYTHCNDGNVETLILTLNGVPRVVDSSHQNFKEIKEGLTTLSVQEMRELLDLKKAVAKQLKRFGNVTVSDSGVEYRGEKVHGLLADRMMQMLNDGYNIAPWALFMENLQQNPAKHAVDELYLWLERSNMPITERGNFLAYKKVREDYTSYHRNADGSFFHNDIGTLCSMPRNKVDDNRNRTCSTGLHFCSWDYLPSYMGHSGKVLLVEVNPAHVVSIPSDYNNAKGRAEAYLVVGEIPQEECEHAFQGIPSVGFHSSKFITYDDPNPIDYSSIEDNWYDDYEMDEDEEWYSESYEEGYEQGKRDAIAFKYSDAAAAFEPYFEDYDYDSFYDGYVDGHWVKSEDLANAKSDYPDFGDDQMFEDFYDDEDDDWYDDDYEDWLDSLDETHCSTFSEAVEAMDLSAPEVTEEDMAYDRGFRQGMRDEIEGHCSPIYRTFEDNSKYWKSYISGYNNGNNFEA